MSEYTFEPEDDDSQDDCPSEMSVIATSLKSGGNASSQPRALRRTFYSTRSTINTISSNDIKNYHYNYDYSTSSINNNLRVRRVNKQSPYPRFQVQTIYEDDELCRRNKKGRLEFGIVSRYENDGKNDLKVFWTLAKEIEEQDLDLGHPELYDDVSLEFALQATSGIIVLKKKQ